MLHGRSSGHDKPPADHMVRNAKDVDDGTKQQTQIEPQAQVADVIKIVAEFHANTSQVRVGRQLDLGQAGHAGAYA